MIIMTAVNFKKLIDNYQLKLRRLFSTILTSNPITTYRISAKRNELLKLNYDPNIKKLIVFLTPGYDYVCGGILSISSMYNETQKLKDVHNSEVIICTLPGDPLLLKYTKFKNQNFMYGFSQVISYFKNLEKLIIHIPEEFTGQFNDNISKIDYLKLKKIKDLRINILIQNIESGLNSLKDIKTLSNHFENVTGTTAHEKYSNTEISEIFGFPLHKLSVYISPDQYNIKKYSEKENLMIVSPDKHPLKSRILKSINEELPDLKIQVIKGLTYEKFKEVISKAKWALTFGEGLDGYFIETIFSGGISFSVYNVDFFTEDFESLETLYNSYDELKSKIIVDIIRLDKKEPYTSYQSELYDICSKYYDYEAYIDNLKSFYMEKYNCN